MLGLLGQQLYVYLMRYIGYICHMSHMLHMFYMPYMFYVRFVCRVESHQREPAVRLRGRTLSAGGQGEEGILLYGQGG